MNSIQSHWSRAAGLAVCLFSLALPMAAQNHVHYSRSELGTMMRQASTADQCKTLATWFREEEVSSRSKAGAENRDYERYKNLMVPAKFPTRADSARRLGDYYSYKADQNAAFASRFETQLSRLDPSYRAAISTGPSPARAPGATASAPLSQNEKMLLDRIQRLEQQVAQPRPQ